MVSIGIQKIQQHRYLKEKFMTPKVTYVNTYLLILDYTGWLFCQ